MLTLLTTLASIAASYGLSWLVNRIQSNINSRQGLSTDQVMKLTDEVLDNVRVKGQDAYDKAVDQLNNVPYVQTTGALKKHISKAKIKLKQNASQEARKLNNLNTKVDSLKNRSNTFAMSSDDYKRSKAGQRDFEQIKSDAKNLADSYEKGV